MTPSLTACQRRPLLPLKSATVLSSAAATPTRKAEAKRVLTRGNGVMGNPPGLGFEPGI
jgi:hypothetical protein